MSVDTFFFSIKQIESRPGFDDQEMVEEVKKLPHVTLLIEKLALLGFRYAGDTHSDSNAYTDIKEKKIFIRKNKTHLEALLSLIYEITNASNASKLKNLHDEYLSDDNPTTKKALKYATEILRIEAEAVYNRSKAAIILGLESLVKNQNYLEITKKHNDDSNSAIQALYLEMLENGMVHSGKKKAVNHYIEQYFEQNRSRNDIPETSFDNEESSLHQRKRKSVEEVKVYR